MEIFNAINRIYEDNMKKIKDINDNVKVVKNTLSEFKCMLLAVTIYSFNFDERALNFLMNIAFFFRKFINHFNIIKIIVDINTTRYKKFRYLAPLFVSSI